jgi:uncharacterized membrane protein ArfB
MDFAMQWLWYVAGFLAGSAVAWVVVTVSIKRTSAEEVPADAPGSPETGTR